MKKYISVSLTKSENTVFQCDDLYFDSTTVEGDSLIKISFNVICGESTVDPLIVRSMLQEIFSEYIFLVESPKELIEYIKKYEEERDPTDAVLFHDFRTRYIDFVKTSESKDILLIGYNISGSVIYFVVKGNSYHTLKAFSENLATYCQKKEYIFSSNEYLRWIYLEKYMKSENKYIRDIISDGFLKSTLDDRFFSKYKEIFQKINSDGYFSKSLYEEYTTKLEENPERRVPIKQMQRYLRGYWKKRLEVKNGSDVLFLHNEMPDKNNGSIVYSLSPSLLAYYKLHWFEDFCSNLIDKISWGSEFELIGIRTGQIYNFFCDGEETHEREIDIMLGIAKTGVYRNIAIECKTTLSKKEIERTNKKCREKVLASMTEMIDAFIHIGCFNNDVVMEHRMEGINNAYSKGVLESNSDETIIIPDVPYFAFSISSVDSLKKSLLYIINIIFNEW